jgi:type I restriction enzyme S subunit
MNWTRQRLDQLGYLSRGRSRHRPRDAAHLYDGPYPFIQTADVKHAGLYITEYEQTYSEAGLEQSKLWPAGTLCITIAANIADTAILGFDACFPDSVIGFVADEKKADARFVKYLFDATIQRRVQQFTQGAAQDNLSQEKLLSINFLVPNVVEQTRIANILSAYDELIGNNRRRMQLLEDAARELYREWFVRLRFPGYEHTRIINGVPEGWERKFLADACASLEDGDWIESKDQGGEDYRLLQISNIGVNEFVETGNFRFITDETFRRLNCHEILPGQILVSRMPKPIGRAWLVSEMPWRMITAVDVAIIATNDDIADPYFLTYLLNSPASLEHCERRAVGATRPRIARRELAGIPILLPPRVLQQLFREITEPLNQQRAILYRENEKLRTARDLLLPRLMSGEIAV